MPRHPRIEFPGAIYHVTIRGNARQDIFSDDHDRERFLERLAESVDTYGVRLYLFCLMNNHVHLLLDTPGANLSRFMQSLETGYTVYRNLRYETVGHLFQGRYKAKLVEGDEYLLKLSRYVHLNPVCVEKAKELPLKQRLELLQNYPWSSYRSYIGEAKRLDFVTYGPVLAQMITKKKSQQRKYRQFIEEGLAEPDADFLEMVRESPSAIGGDEFQEWVRKACMELVEKAARPEDVSFRRKLPVMSKERVLEITSMRLGVRPSDLRERRRKSVLRPIAARMLAKFAGLTQRQVADALGMKSGAAASVQVQKAGALKNKNAKTALLIAAIEDALDKQISEMARRIPVKC